jgi:plastocyanin
MLFKNIIAVYGENYTKATIKKTALQIVKTAGTYNYHCALKG